MADARGFWCLRQKTRESHPVGHPAPAPHPLSACPGGTAWHEGIHQQRPQGPLHGATGHRIEHDSGKRVRPSRLRARASALRGAENSGPRQKSTVEHPLSARRSENPGCPPRPEVFGQGMVTRLPFHAAPSPLPLAIGAGPSRLPLTPIQKPSLKSATARGRKPPFSEGAFSIQ